MTPPTAEGGALRSQDPRTSADPTGLDGTVLRLDPDTGDAAARQPGHGRPQRAAGSSPTACATRSASRSGPGTTEVYVGDVGWLTGRRSTASRTPTSQVRNFGWPCYEGIGRQSGYDGAGLNICENLYAAGAAPYRPLSPTTTPRRSPARAARPAPRRSRASRSTTAATFPAAYRGAMFFADYTRSCIWVMFAGADGRRTRHATGVRRRAASPVDLEIGPGGDLYYADVDRGSIQRIRAINPNQAPDGRVRRLA